VVGFDSIIPPGREGHITESVNLGNYHAGAYTKSATILSNAKNMPSMQISIHWIIKAYVSAATSYIQLAKDKNGNLETDVVFSSEKANLKITDASFKAVEDGPATNNKPAWQSELPIAVSYAFEKDSLRQDGYHDYKYKLIIKMAGSQKKNGEFIFKTNHEKSPEVKVQGGIDPGK